MTIDERLKVLMNTLDPDMPYRDFKAAIRSALLEVARDQRHACAEAVNGCEQWLNALEYSGTAINLNEAHQAVMNAEIK
jgi:hypothetical protein